MPVEQEPSVEAQQGQSLKADKIGIPLPPRVAAHYQRVRARPVVRQVLAEIRVPLLIAARLIQNHLDPD